jgi:hypothetical protein
MAQGLLTQEDGYLYGKDALMQPVLDAYARTGRTPSPSDAARLGLLGYIAPVRSPYLDVEAGSRLRSAVIWKDLIYQFSRNFWLAPLWHGHWTSF